MSKRSRKLQRNAHKKHSQWGDVVRRLFRNKLAVAALVFVFFLVIVAILAPVIAPYDYTAQEYANRLAPLSLAHPFGTDEYGRDILSRMIYGARTSLLEALGGVVICLVIGGVLGLVTGFFGGWVDTIIMRILDIFMAIPALLLAVTIQAALAPACLTPAWPSQWRASRPPAGSCAPR